MENYRYKIQKDSVSRDEKLSIYIYIIPRLKQLKQFLEVGFNLPPLRVSLNYLSRIINISPYHLKKNLYSLGTHHYFSFLDLEKLLNLNNLMTITIEPSLALIRSCFLVLSINSKHSSVKFIEKFFKKNQISYFKEETLWGFYIRILAKIPRKIFIFSDDYFLLDRLIEVLKWPIRVGIILIYIIQPAKFFKSKEKEVRIIYTLKEEEWKEILEE